MKSRHVYILAGVLISLALFVTYQKIVVLGLPLEPAETTEAWMVEAKVTFKASGKGAKVDFTIPKNPPAFLMFDEDYIASAYNLAVDEVLDVGRENPATKI